MSRPATVLVADDQATFRRSICEVLAQRGFRVLQAADGVQALATCRTEQPDVIVLDIVMPDMDGVEMCRALREDPNLPYIPIIFFSGRDAVADRVDALRAGGDDFVQKDVDDEELVARIEALVRIRRLLSGQAQAQAALTSRDLGNRLADAFAQMSAASRPLSLILIDAPESRVDELEPFCGGGFVATTPGGVLAAVIPQVHFGGALAIAEQMWRHLAGDQTAAIGVACFPNRNVSNAGDLMKFARAALDRARAESPAHICLYQHQAYLFLPE